MTIRHLLFLGALLAAGRAAAQAPARRLSALRATAPVRVDGVLDEADWARADVARDFTQADPDAGQPSSEHTEVRILYDEEHLYVGAFLQHRDTRDIVVNELRKDFDGSSTDYFALILDTFHDRANGYQFGVNPRGARWDSQKSNDGRERNLSWDGEWVVRTRLTPDGWYAEFAIPFRTMQLPATDGATWGVNFVRHLQRRMEDSYWAPVPRQFFVDRLSLAGTLAGIHGVGRGANLRLKPYLASTIRRDPAAALGGPGAATFHREAAGLDARYAISGRLALDLTLNTDFSEVEADEQQLARSRSALFFPEKREFFLDNAGIFQFGSGSARTAALSSAAGTSASGRDNAIQNDLVLLFTRRMGLSPDGRPIPLAGGARLSGHLGDLTLGALAVRQRADGATGANDVAALRVRRRVGASSDVGVMLLDRERAGSADRVGGFDAHLQLTPALSVFGYAALSASDSTREAVGEKHAARGGIRWRDGDWEAEVSSGRIGRAFADPLGFVPQTGVVRRQALLVRRLRPAALDRWVRAIHPAVGVTDGRLEVGGFDARYWEARLPITFNDGSVLEFGANPNDELLRATFTVSAARGVVVDSGRYRFTDRFVSLSSSRARRAWGTLRVSGGEYYDGRRTVVVASLRGRLNPHVGGAIGVTRDRVTLATGGVTTSLVTARLDVGFNTNAFLNAIAQYNSETGATQANVRLHVIHRPLSDLFLVVNSRAGRGERALDDAGVALKFTRMVAF